MDNKIIELLNDKPFPRRLADPLFSLRLPLIIVNVITLLIVIFVGIYIYPRNPAILGTLGITLTGLFFFFSVLVLAIPDKRTNAFYLRSFRKDSESKRIREHLEVLLGNKFRLSGIRDPKKRVSYVIRPLIIASMVLRYAGARYLNLEAGNDWKARLWVSLRDAKIIFLDLRDITEFVEEEVRLCISAVSLNRIVFIVDSESDITLLKESMAQSYNLSQSQKGQLNIVSWCDSDQDNSAFMSAVRDVIENLPQDGKSFYDSSFSLVADSVYTKKQLFSERFSNWSQIILGFVLLTLLVVFPDYVEFNNLLTAALIILGLIFTVYIYYLYIKSIIGKKRKIKISGKFNVEYERYLSKQLKTAYGLSILMLSGYAISVYGVKNVYEGYVDRAVISSEESKMATIHMAMEMYRLDTGHYPSHEDGLSALLSPPLQYKDVWSGPYVDGSQFALTDSWGNQYRFWESPTTGRVELSSDGPDGIQGTFDDISR